MKNSHFVFLHRPVTGTYEFGSSAMSGVRPAVSGIQAWSRLRLFASLHAAALATVAVVWPAFAASAASVFTLTNTALPGVAYSSVVCGDFNNDGKRDVLLTGASVSFKGICQVWQNQSNGVFTNNNGALPGISTNAVTSSSVAQGDFDNDGRSDFLITGLAGVDANHFPVYISQIWLNRGNGTFTNIQAGLHGVDTGAVALGDFDNDGNLDILLTGYSSTGALSQVWLNLGNGAFTNINAGLPGVLYSSVALGDYDNDGKLDILLTGTTNGFGSGAISQLWRNLGNGTFAKVPIGLPGISQGAVAWGDFDQDGRLDILLTGYTQTGAVCQAWRNLGNGNFTNMNIAVPGVYESSVALADYDNDGKLDILLAGVNNQSNLLCQVWRNTGNWVFTNINAGLPGVRSGSVAWADFDNDGRVDLLLSGLDTNSNPVLQVYHNNTASKSTFAPRIIGLKTLANRSHQLSFGGPIGFGYTVWASSSNFIQWSALGVPSEISPGTFQFTDLSATNVPSRFYRVSSP
jgi:hypothetical protein